jgi:hypothetical protein
MGTLAPPALRFADYFFQVGLGSGANLQRHKIACPGDAESNLDTRRGSVTRSQTSNTVDSYDSEKHGLSPQDSQTLTIALQRVEENHEFDSVCREYKSQILQYASTPSHHASAFAYSYNF